MDYLNKTCPTHLIANLGEGLGCGESTELFNEFINYINDVSLEMMLASAECTCAFLWNMCY